MCSTTLEIRSVQLFRGPGRTAKGGNYGFVRTPLPRETGKHPGKLSDGQARWLAGAAPEMRSECWFTEHPVCPGGAPPGHGPPTGPTASPGTPRPCRSLGRLVRATRPASGHTDLPLGASFMVCVMRVSTFIGTLLKKSPRFGGHYWLSFFCFMNGGCGDQWR